MGIIDRTFACLAILAILVIAGVPLLSPIAAPHYGSDNGGVVYSSVGVSVSDQIYQAPCKSEQTCSSFACISFTLPTDVSLACHVRRDIWHLAGKAVMPGLMIPPALGPPRIYS